MTKVLVIGGGFGGCCSAHLLSQKGWDITLVEKNPFLGGGNKTFFYGGHPYTYGPRHFLSDDYKLFEFLNKYVPMRRIDQVQQNLSFVESDKRFYTYAIHEEEVEKMPDYEKIKDELELDDSDEIIAANFEEYVSGSLGNTLYSKFFDTYSKKMWDIKSNTELDADFGWQEHLGQKKMKLNSGNKAIWDGRISAFPLKINGYDDYFDIATENCNVLLETEIETFDLENYRVKINEEWKVYDLIVNTIYPEVVLNNAFGPLRWMGREFLKIVLPVPQVFPGDIYFLYYPNQEIFTRITEYKKFYKYESPTTLLGLEIPSKKNKLYPYPTLKAQAQHKKYMEAMPEKVFSIGRMATYRYIDVDDIIAQSMELADRL